MSAQRVAPPGATERPAETRGRRAATGGARRGQESRATGPERMSAWVRDRSPWLVCGASVALTGAGLLLYGQNRRVAGTPQFFDPVTPLVAVTFPAVGAFLAARNRRDGMAWILCSAALLGVSFFADQYAAYTLVTSPGTLPAGRWLAWLGSWTWIPGFLVPRTVLLLLFPDGRPPTPRWRAVTGAIVVLIGATTVFVAVAHLPAVGDPLAPSDLPHVVGLLIAPVGLVCLLARYRRSEGRERDQLRLLAWPAALGILAPLLAAVLVLIAPDARLSSVIYEAIGVVSLLGLLGAIWVGIVRYRLFGLDPYEIDVFLNRTLVSVGLAGAVLALYAVVVRLLDAGALDAVVSVRPGVAVSLVATAVVVVAVPPLAQVIQRVVDRLRFDKLAARALADLGQRLESTLTPEAVLPAIAQTIASALKLPYVAVEVGHGDDVIARAASGTAGERVVAMELVHQNEQVGRLLVAPRSPAGELDPAQLSLLKDLANQAGVAAYVVRLTSELQRSRSRVVAAADAERRRIERNLHDGAQQHLVALAINLRLARDLADNDPQRVKAMLDQVGVEIHDTLQELRDLARGIYPPLLTDRGLGEALEAAAGRSPVPAVVDASRIGRYPPEVEAAVYFCCMEALQNVTKHAGPGAGVTIRVWDSPDALRFEVSDDGTGFDTGRAETGQGLTNMRDRVGAIGGTLTVESRPGRGTTVSGVIPRP